MPYTRLAEPVLERRIDQDLGYLVEEIRRVVPAKRLAAIVLGGGYGRGDGGMRITDQGPAPYNDYDLFVVLRRASYWRRRSIRRSLAQQRPRWESALDLEVEACVCTEQGLRRWPLTLRQFDLAEGHRVLWGDASIRDALELPRGGTLPLVEGARLLVNRGSLLAYCKGQRAARSKLAPEERSRVIRYLHKAILACGDAVLMSAGCYATDSDLRVARLRTIPGPPSMRLDALRAWYAYVVDSRRVGRETIPPGCTSLDEFFARVWLLYEQVHRWFEGERLRVKPLRWTDYIRAPFNKYPLSDWTARHADRARHLGGPRALSRRAATLRYGHENVVAGWLAELLYLRGQPAIATLHQVSSESWNQQFREYWSLWSASG